MKRILLLSLSLILLLSLSAFAQDAQQNLTLIVTGQPGQIPIVQMNGKSYVDIDALARLTNSSVSIKGNQVILTPLGSAPSTLAADHEPSASTAQLKLVAERAAGGSRAFRSRTAGEAGRCRTKRRGPRIRGGAYGGAGQGRAESRGRHDQLSAPEQHQLRHRAVSRDQDVLNIQPVIPLHLTKELEPDHPHHSAHHLAARRLAADRPGLVRPRRLESQPLLLSRQARQSDLGRGAGARFSHRDRTTAGSGKSQRGPGCRRSFYSRSLGHWRSGQQCLVVCRYGQPSAGESVSAAVLH